MSFPTRNDGDLQSNDCFKHALLGFKRTPVWVKHAYSGVHLLSL